MCIHYICLEKKCNYSFVVSQNIISLTNLYKKQINIYDTKYVSVKTYSMMIVLSMLGDRLGGLKFERWCRAE